MSDHAPSISRYQEEAGGYLRYADCLKCGRPCQIVPTGYREDSPEQEPALYWRHVPTNLSNQDQPTPAAVIHENQRLRLT